ncbi:MAG: hypothetical protein JO165_01515 [Candidatus Eremiobacteraeota bacterium]|nr:hypothetical protein [Candidatus Eremiobacteraeota bacterium]
MSSVDPFAALFAQNAAEAALADLSLGIPLDLLQMQVNVGDLLAATVLPATNGYDSLEILGKQIAAQLPPEVRPGDTLLLEVTGSSGNRVYVANLGTLDPEQPLPSAVLQTADVVETTSAQETPRQTQLASPPVSTQPSTDTAQQTPPPVAPPRSVFVAASVTRSAAAVDAQAKASATPATAIPAGIEARIAAARAAAPSAPASATIAASKQPVLANVSVPVVARNPVVTNVQTRTVAPERLLETLRVPVNTTTLTAVRVASDAVRRLPEVLTRLEQALTAITKDARAATLRTLSAFVSRIDPANETAMPQQIASYVSHIADGPEAKAVQLLQALSQTKDDQEARAAGSGASERLAPNIVAQAQSVERAAAVDHDLKSIVLSMLRQPPIEHTPELAQVLRDAVITLTGAQLQNLQNNTPSSTVLSLALPVFYKKDGAPAQLRIDRKNAKGAGSTLDNDNFSVAFVLDTASLGTVAIDLHASDRRVSVNVRTENEHAVGPFKSTLSELVGRLERLRYRVARTSAEIAPRAGVVANLPPPDLTSVPKRGLDLQA